MVMAVMMAALVAGGGLYACNASPADRSEGDARLSGASAAAEPECRPAPLAERSARVLITGLP